MERAQNKAARLIQIENLLLAYPDGLTQAEIGRRLQVDRATINRYIVDLPKHIYIDDDGRLKLDRTADLINVRLNLHETLAVHLASRLLATRMDKQNPHAAAALRKLGNAMERWAPRISRHVYQSAAMIDEAGQKQDPRYLEVLEKLTLAWAEQRKVQIWHRSETAGAVFEYTFSPYFIEPYAVGQTTHLIGWSELAFDKVNATPGKLRTLKVERIERVSITREAYTIPDSFDPRVLLSDAWGVWYTESEPAEVVLKFHPRVAHRLQETRWHRSEVETELPDGSLLWQAKVSEPQEMIPWVRGWGADCEVLEPESLRKALEKEARRLARLYGVMELENIPQYFHLWAKTDKEHGSDKLHPLIYHMLDVGESTLALWQYALSERTRQTFADWLGLDIELAGHQLAFWAALHDLGKAAPGFQRKYSACMPKLKEIGFVFPNELHTPAPHGILSAWALKELLPPETGLSAQDAKQIAFALGGHHGAWPTNDRLQSPALQSSDKGSGLWDIARKELLLTLKEIYQPVKAIQLPQEGDKQADLNAFLTLFSGLVSVADWIGSMVEHFPLEDEYMQPANYASRARQQAKDALEKLGWLGWQADGNLLSFAAMFPQTPTPREIQAQTIESASNLDLPALVILEAPTGIGKTEAALYLADTWLQTSKGKGIYIAMPTQATSNQMFGRVVEFLEKRYPGQTINTHLVHGAALLEETDEKTPELFDVSREDKADDGTVKAETWFLPRKRTLLAPFGVGTVDQALMSVLQTNHFFVRMFGLAQKVVVFDEVHAYDTYMSTLFQRLLRWLRSIGTSVILLSATLPNKTRQELVGAWLGADDFILPETDYPRLTIASAEKANVIPLPAPESRALQLAWVAPSPEKLAEHLTEKLREGGCAAVICNRVQRAQEVYAALKDAGIVEAENLILFHARFPFQWRKDIEDRVLDLFSKNGQRPKKAIVVATQVIEQSLDLDFDYMLTDLAPVDLLLQRAGRLHRHAQNQSSRPVGLANPVMAIGLPEMRDNLPQFGLDARIYELSTLLRTWHILHSLHAVTLPDQTSGLIESVYGNERADADLEPVFLKALQKADETARIGQSKEIHQAKQRLVAMPEDEDYLTDRNEGLEEDNPDVNDAFRALTRLADPSVAIICLHETVQGIALEPDGSNAPIDIKKRPNLQLAKKMLRHAVSIQRRDVVNHLLKYVHPTADWRKSAAVRYHYSVIFDQNGECHLDGADFILKLTRELGLQVIKKEAA